MILTLQQEQAIKAVKDWYKNSSKQFFYISGFAGTGKSTCIKYIVNELGFSIDSYRVIFAAYIGKAASVMRSKGLTGATTIHSLIYEYVQDDTEHKPIFRLNKESKIRDCSLVVIDECSVISEKTALDLLSFGKKILVLGDEGQLNPVDGHSLFTKTKPDFSLTEIHRQAKENPIIRYSEMVRKGERVPFVKERGFRKMTSDEFDVRDFFTADQIITGKNVSRRQLNLFIKDYYDFKDVYPVEPDIKLICIRNNHNDGILNGETFYTKNFAVVSDDSEKLSFEQSLENRDTKEVFPSMKISKLHFDEYVRTISKEERLEYGKYKNVYNDFDYGYAITVHKSQASQWKNVILWDDNFGYWDRDTRNKFLYTALTRAEEEVTWVFE